MVILIENRKGEVINFDIIVPTEKGAVYICKFVGEMELASVSTGLGKWVIVNNAHCLLRHRNVDSVRKTANELSWVFTHGMFNVCEHCAKAMVKQKNV